jgi:hypothetical protein
MWTTTKARRNEENRAVFRPRDEGERKVLTQQPKKIKEQLSMI